MNLTQQHLQSLYHAYCETQLLWKKNTVHNIDQLELPQLSSFTFLRKLDRKLRLGQLAEQFVFNQMESYNGIEILAENIQIQRDKQTLGELDALITFNNQPIHLEIIYKFYVFDMSVGKSELEHWIGPNRKDSLSEKLNKLKEKQLPLLHSEDCKSKLEHLELNHFSFEQFVLFKAQLFVPYHKHIEFNKLNANCVCGFYINTSQLDKFKDGKFYMPSKLDWFLNPHTKVEWTDLNAFKKDASVFLDQKQSPMFWFKNSNGELSKGFLVWW